MSLLADGQSIRGTYEVERVLGEGAFAVVYRVRHRFLGRQAMKVFKMVGMTVEETEEMLGEATMLSLIGHPNIVRVFDANTTETAKGICGFFTMEYVAGGNLEQFWHSHGAMFVPVETSVEILRQVCRGLSVAHTANPPIVHRDIKPQNILVGYEVEGLRVRLSDFGLAKRVNPLTLLASARGTCCFKAPEAFTDPQGDSCAGDVWAIGSTLYLLLTDRLPYVDVGEVDSLKPKRFEQPVIPPSRLNARVDARLDQIVLRALALEPAQRYATAVEILGDLEQWKPAQRGSGEPRKAISAGLAKSALGVHTPLRRDEARKLATKALRLARQAGKLQEAADLMEEAINKCADLPSEYQYKLRLWRRGIAM